MFVQTHFQRARHQAASVSAAAGGSSQQPHGHSSASHHHQNHLNHNHHYHHNQQQHYQHQQQNQTNQKHQHQNSHRDRSSSTPPVCDRRLLSAQRAAPVASHCAPTIKGGQKIKEPRRIHAHRRTSSTDEILNNSHHHHRHHTHPHSHHHNQASTNQRRHPSLHRASEFEIETQECAVSKSSDVHRQNSITESDGNHHRQMISTSVGNVGTHFVASNRTPAVPVAARISIPTYTTLRLRSVSSSSNPVACLHQRPSGEILAQELQAFSLATKTLRSRPLQRHRSVSNSRRNIRLKGADGRRLSSFEYKLERALNELVGPFANVGRSLTTGGTVKANSNSNNYDQHESHLLHKLLILPIKQTLHCLVLFLLNFLHYHLQTVRHFLTGSTISVDYQHWCESDIRHRQQMNMRASVDRNQRPMTAGSAHSFDASQMMSHDFSRPNALYNHNSHTHHPAFINQHYPATNHHHHHHHQQQQQQRQRDNNLAWLANATLLTTDIPNQPPHHIYAAHQGGHIHRHNHASLASYYGEPTANHDYRDHVMPGAPGQVVSRAGEIGASQMWKWHKGHTVDGAPPVSHWPLEEDSMSNQAAPSNGYSNSFDNHEHTHHHWPWPQTTQVAQTHQNQQQCNNLPPGAPAAAGRGAQQSVQHFGLPGRRRETSISSPTLSEFENADLWRQQVAPTGHLPPEWLLNSANHPKSGVDSINIQTHDCDKRQPLVNAQQDNHRHHRQLPKPPLVHAGRSLEPASLTANTSNNQRPRDRRLSSIMGSDSELYARRDPAQYPSTATNGNSSIANSSLDSSPSASSASARAHANLMRFELDKQTGTYIHHHHHHHHPHPHEQQQTAARPPLESWRPKARARLAMGADRRRLARQTSSLSGASQSCATTTTASLHVTSNATGNGHHQREQQLTEPSLYGAAEQQAGVVAAASKPSLTRQFQSLQTDSTSRGPTNMQVNSASTSGSPVTCRLSKSDNESARRAPAGGSSGRRPPPPSRGSSARAVVEQLQQQVLAGSSDRDQLDGQQGANKDTLSRKHVNLAESGKSKSMMGQNHHQAQGHASSIGVLGRAVSLAGAKRRLGFKRKGGLNSLSVHRSEEIFPQLDPTNELSMRLFAQRHQRRRREQSSSNTTASNSLNSDCSYDGPSALGGGGGCELAVASGRWLSQFGSESPDPKVCFVEGLGVGQIASRQALVSPYLGDIQVSLSDRRGMLEVEIIRVRQLQPKAGAKRLPSPYVKVYLMRNKKCAAKFKTHQLQHTLDPLYQQLFIFRDDYSNCVLQIIVWGDYGKKDRKSLMGIVQIHLNDLDMSNMVISWYKLFNASSMVAATASSPKAVTSSKALRQTLSSTKLGDLATIQKQENPEYRDVLALEPAGL